MHPNVWHPFTSIKSTLDPLKVTSGDGILLTLEDGKEIIDCISSWWVNIHGHSHPEISKAISEQAQKLEHVIFSNFTHQSAEDVATELALLLPGNLNKVFFSDNGSTAVEVALKVAIQHWQNKGEKRQKFIAFEGGYHGDTFGAMSAGSRTIFSDVFSSHLFDVDFVDYPSTWEGDTSVGEKEDAVIEKIEQLLSDSPDEYAGIIIEPLVQGAGGMNMCREEFLQKLHWVNRQYDTLLIFDEVMTGFGRTGEFFACKKAQVQPDIICLAKGLTGGFLPLSVTVCTDEIYESFNSDDPLKTFWHGHSYTANPLGCAAAVASLKILKESEKRIQSFEAVHRKQMKRFEKYSDVKKIRYKGTIVAFDLETDQADGYLNPVSNTLKKHCVEYGLLIRPLGNTIYLMLPYCVTDEELETVYSRLENLLVEKLSIS
ncbi:MAG: adenosylmethionine--8-amino-7-oxononanoate transaminase [Balneolaceae bacterium]